MKKLLSILIIGVLLVIVAGCDNSMENQNTSNMSQRADSTKIPESEDTAPTVNDTYEVGDIIYFGKYEQDNNTSNGDEKIAWRILEKEDGKVFVLSEQLLGNAQNYHNEDVSKITWETCSLRSWLNDTFINKAFSPEEQKKIIPTTVKTADHSCRDCLYGYTDGGNDTVDKVFLLSRDEAKTYFPIQEERIITEPAFYLTIDLSNTRGDKMWARTTDWWLRSPGCTGYLVDRVEDNGLIRAESVYENHNGVRPAMWIEWDKNKK